MNQISRKSMIGAFALVASLSAPLAFAQSADPATDPTAPPAPPTTQPAPAPQTDAMAPTQAPTPTQAPAKQSWNDVDVDQNGKISKAEAATVPALGQVFDEADSDADGALTTDEYKNYVAKVQSGAATPPGG